MGNILFQNYDMYSNGDHETWAILCQRHQECHSGKFAKPYLDGLDKLQLDYKRIINIAEVSQKLESISGWTLIPVSGLLPTKDFFHLLIEKKYPVTVYIRTPDELDFSEQPDIFHDVFGHLPLLTDAKFTKFLTAYSTIALKYIDNDKALDFLGRLYWFTYEMGLIREVSGLKPYGGAIITSANEIINIQDDKVQKHAFSLDHIFQTAFNSFKIQKEYFVIDSFEDLFLSLETIENKLIEHLQIPQVDTPLEGYTLNQFLGEGFNDVIGFLNGIQFRFRDAISFVAGQPDEGFFEIENHINKFSVFVDYRAKQSGESREKVVNGIGQYNKTKGIINDIIADYLKNDEDINVNETDILMTVGAQEAFSIIVSSICNRDKDVIIIEDPSYIGVSSFAKIFNYQVEGVKANEDGIDLVQLEKKIVALISSDRRVKLVYVIPDYQNPSGSCMSVNNRLELLNLADRYNFLIIEDSVYNSFTYAQKKNPTLKSLDKNKRVIYVGSFSKSIFPGLRVGLIAADQRLGTASGSSRALIDEMAKVKAQLTNNTSTISQAILGGVLLDLNCSLSEWSKPKFNSYKTKCNCMIDALDEHIGLYQNDWAKEIHWNVPQGGFFIKMSVPFIIDNDSVVESASKFNIIFCPMRNFYLKGGGERELRLTFSNLSLSEIKEGTKLLAAYLKYRVEKENLVDQMELIQNS